MQVCLGELEKLVENLGCCSYDNNTFSKQRDILNIELDENSVHK